jgi:hypothetical protein
MPCLSSAYVTRIHRRWPRVGPRRSCRWYQCEQGATRSIGGSGVIAGAGQPRVTSWSLARCNSSFARCKAGSAATTSALAMGVSEVTCRPPVICVDVLCGVSGGYCCSKVSHSVGSSTRSRQRLQTCAVRTRARGSKKLKTRCIIRGGKIAAGQRFNWRGDSAGARPATSLADEAPSLADEGCLISGRTASGTCSAVASLLSDTPPSFTTGSRTEKTACWSSRSSSLALAAARSARRVRRCSNSRFVSSACTSCSRSTQRLFHVSDVPMVMVWSGLSESPDTMP